MDDRHGRVLDLLYSAAVEAAVWPTAMAALGDLVGAGSSVLTRSSLTGSSGTAMVTRADPALVQHYFGRWADHNPLSARRLRGYRRNWRPSVVLDTDWVDREAFKRSAFFNEFLRPIEAESVIMVRLALDEEHAVLNIARPARRGLFQSDDVAALAPILPHLVRAYGLGRRLAEAGQLAAALAQGLDQSDHGVMVLSPEGRILHANDAALRTLKGGRRLRAEKGQLRAVDPMAAQQLDALVARAGSRDDAVRRGGELGFGAEGLRFRLKATVAPLQPGAVAMLTSGPAVLVSLSGPELALSPVSEAGARLTARERDCLSLVAQGKTDWEISVILGLSEATARFHVDNARKKLGAVNRAQAVARLARMGLI